MALKFGLAIPYNQARTAAQWAQLAEEAGWDGFFVGDAIWCEDPLIALAAAAMTTRRIRLGVMLIPAPLRTPWKIASESLALDRLSEGRLILSLGAGAVWMGWQAFPDVPTGAKERAAMLDETLDILTLLYQRQPFDYDGSHFHLRLTQMDVMHYPPKPVQQPRIPLWTPVLWPRLPSMRRALKCDGLLVEKLGSDGRPAEATPADVREMRAYVEAHRTLSTPFDIVVSGKVCGLPAAQRQEILAGWAEAGATWWVEGLWGEQEETVTERARQGPPVGGI